MIIDLEKIKISQDFTSDIGVQKEILSIPIRKPDKQWFIQVHPEDGFRIAVAVIELKEERETYIVDPKLYTELQSDLVPKQLLLAVTMQGHSFIWPIRMPGPDGRIDSWNRSALEASQKAVGTWCRVTSNAHVGGYDVWTAKNNPIPPKWPHKSFEEIISLAFKDRVIDSPDHIVLKRLRGEI